MKQKNSLIVVNDARCELQNSIGISRTLGKIDMPTEDNATQEKKRTWTEEIEVSSEKLKEKVEKLGAEASVRRIRIKEPDGDIAVDIPLTVGAVAGGALVLAAPVLAIIGAIAAFFAKVKVEIVREEEHEEKEVTAVDG
ncbi:MAG: DUF4342 domain-containing protein [Boseongicola sp.]|nr:DUF4342 domain-containing protein [Boseongicola sp.]